MTKLPSKKINMSLVAGCKCNAVPINKRVKNQPKSNNKNTFLNSVVIYLQQNEALYGCTLL